MDTKTKTACTEGILSTRRGNTAGIPWTSSEQSSPTQPTHVAARQHGRRHRAVKLVPVAQDVDVVPRRHERHEHQREAEGQVPALGELGEDGGEVEELSEAEDSVEGGGQRRARGRAPHQHLSPPPAGAW